MAIDLNADLGDIIKGLMSKKESNLTEAGAKQSSNIGAKILPFKNSIILFVVAALSFVAYIEYYQKPITKEIEANKTEIKRLEDLKQKTLDLQKKITYLKSKLSKSRQKYIESLSHFGNSEDLGELYQSISILANKYDMVVLNIKEIPAPPAPAPKKGEPLVVPDKNKPQVSEIIVEVELKGKYAHYIKFKEDLAIAEMLLKVNKENLRVKSTKDEQGNIFVSLNLSTYAIDKSQFKNIIGNDKEVK